MSRDREITLNEVGEKIKRDVDASDHQMGINSRQQLGPAVNLNTITPCAACKLLRRRCARECPFAPYFSPHEPHKFASVHKVFGASNVSKMLMEVPESQRADTANSLVYEANLRIRDPVYGCMGAISALQQQVQVLQAELNAVRADIIRFKMKESSANMVFPTPQAALLAASGVVSIAAPPPMLITSSQPASIPPPNTTVMSSSSMPISAPPSNNAYYNSITSDKVSYFN